MNSGVVPLPAAKDIRDLLEGVVGRDVDILIDSESLQPNTPGGVIVGQYDGDVEGPLALIAMDTALAAYLGAAIALMPPATGQAAAQEGFLDDVLIDNVFEVLNIAASVFNVDGGPHLRLVGIEDSVRAPLSAGMAGWLRGYVPRLDAAVRVKGYGDGRISVLLK